MNAASGVFTWTAATAVNGTFTQTCGFQPQVILFFSSGNSSATDAGSTTLHKRQNFGVVTRDGSTLSRWCVASIARTGNTTMNTGRIKRTDAVVATADPTDVTGEMALESLLDIDAVANWPADGFRVIVDDQGAVDLRVQWLAWGGDVTNVASGELTEPGATGNQDITSPGFQPDLVILGTIMGTATGNEGPLSHSSICVGFISPDGQYTHWGTSEDALGTAITKRYGVPVECLAMDNLTNQELDGRAEGSMLSTGFRLNWLERTGSRKAFWTAIKGGGYSLQSFLISTGAAATVTSTFGFQPRGIMVIGHIDTGQSAQDSPNDHDAIGIGFGTSTSNRTAQFVHDVHAATAGSIRMRIEHDAIYCEGDTTLGSALDIDAILSTGVRFINDDPPGGDLFVATLGLGDTLSAPAANFAATVSLALTTVSAFTTSITLAGTATASVTTAASMAIPIEFAAAASLTATTAGVLTTVIRATGAATATLTTAGSLTTSIPLAGAAAGSATLAGAITTAISLAGTTAATLTTAADLTAGAALGLVRHTYLGPHGVPLGRQPLPAAELAATATLAVTVAADLTAPGATLVAAASVTLTTAGALTTAIPLGGAASTATVTTAGALTTVISPRGTASLVLSAQGALQTEIRLAATAQLVLTTQPTMAGTSANFAAAPSLTVTATGSLTTVIRAAGTATLTVTTSPVLTTVIPLAGAATATLTTAPAVLTAGVGFQSAVTATLTATSGLTTQIRMAGTASLVVTTTGQVGTEALLASAVQLRITTAGDIATALLLASQATATLAASGALTTAITLVGESALLVTAIGDFTVTVQPVGDGWIFHLEPVRSHFTVSESDHVARVLAGAHVFDAKDQGDET